MLIKNSGSESICEKKIFFSHLNPAKLSDSDPQHGLKESLFEKDFKIALEL
jgi:hypothetical protein